jgi:hypothetical protein
MADDFKTEENRTPLMQVRTRRKSAFPPLVLIGVFLILVLGLGGTWLWFHFGGDSEPVPTLPPDSMASVPEQLFVLPGLDASDVAVRRLASAVSAHPQLAAWLATDDLVRRFVEAVVDVSRGSSPVPALEVLIPPEPFRVQESGDRLLVDPASFHRYDLLTEVFTSVETPDAVEIYQRLLPLFREAYQELGVPDVTWEETLTTAVENLLAVEVPDRPMEVREAVGRYVYVSRDAESLTPAEKHMLRLGPENARRVQEKLREVAQGLGLIQPEPLRP